MSEAGDKVAFISVPGSYKSGESVQVRYRLSPGLVTHERDRVGLFKVGWTSNRDYYTFEWAPQIKDGGELEESERVVTFQGSRLPPDDGAFYQFCYVVYSGSIKGASRPFQFTNASGYTDDLEVVEINDEDSLLLLRSRRDTELSELHQKVDHLQQANVEVEASLVQVKSEHEKLVVEKKQLKDQCQALSVQLSEAKKSVALKDQELAKLAEDYNENDTKLNSLLVAMQQELEMNKKVKNEMKQELDDITRRIQQMIIAGDKDKDDLLQSREIIEKLRNEKEAVISKKLESETQLRTQCNQLEERLRKLEEEKETLTGRSEYYQAEAEGQYQRVEVMKEQITNLEIEMKELVHELDKEKIDHQALTEKFVAKEQEFNVVQQNLCEVLGNMKEPKNNEPPTSQTDKVDRSALEALQMAYEDIEKRLKFEQKQSYSLRRKVTELEERIKLCQKEYTRVASENLKILKKQNAETATPSQQEQLEHELEVFQLKHDERIAEKNDTIQKLSDDITARNEEVTKLQSVIAGLRHQEQAMKRSIETLNIENEQLKHQLSVPPPNYTPPPYNPGYGPHARPVHQPPPRRPQQQPVSDNSRKCPICNLAYPSRASQKEYEDHVNAHFQGQ